MDSTLDLYKVFGTDVYSENRTIYNSSNSLRANLQSFRIRSKPVNGIIYTTIPIGSIATILKYSIIGSDGYQWILVGINGVYGYAQLDTRNAYIIEGNPGGAMLYARKLAFRVRNVPVNGVQLAMVNIGQSAKIIEFLPKQIDGYQWAKVVYNGITGYSQIDTLNAYMVMF